MINKANESCTEQSMLNRNRYLQAMGIEVWHERASVELMEYYRYDLLDLHRRVKGILLADALLRNEVEGQLVEKIAKATKKQIRGGLQRGLIKVSDWQDCVVVVLGANVLRLLPFLEASQMIVTYPPSELLRNEALKAEAWKALKIAMQRMDNDDEH